MNEERVGKAVLDAAFKVHTVLGPGLMESVYETALDRELERRGFRVERQRAIPVVYEGEQLEVGFRADLIIDGAVLVELKSVEAVTPVFRKIATNYLRLVPLRLGYLINFNVLHLRDGITRIVNGIEGKPFFPKRDSREGGEGSEGRDAETEIPASRETPGGEPSFPKRVSREGGDGGEGRDAETEIPASTPSSTSLPSSASRETPESFR